MTRTTRIVTLSLFDKGLRAGITRNKCAKVARKPSKTPRKWQKSPKSVRMTRFIDFLHFLTLLSDSVKNQAQMPLYVEDRAWV